MLRPLWPHNALTDGYQAIIKCARSVLIHRLIPCVVILPNCQYAPATGCQSAGGNRRGETGVRIGYWGAILTRALPPRWVDLMTWWGRNFGLLSALLALCKGIYRSPVDPPPPPPHKWPVMRGFDVLFIVSGNTVLPGVCALTWHYCNASFFLWFAAIILSVFANSWDAYTHICQSCVTGIHWQRWHTPERYW